jgi:Asp-tRNA(Asn)/Glu-tRNA(Gln) amidotransferase A subunit family amidase
VGGPLAHSVRDCIEFFKIQCVDEPHLKGDPFRAPVPFRQHLFDEMQKDKSKIKVGILK